MAARRNTGCVYTGRVGAPMRPRRRRPAALAPVSHMPVLLIGGPLDGKTVQIARHSGRDLLPIRLRGQVGQYVDGIWQPATPHQAL